MLRMKMTQNRSGTLDNFISIKIFNLDAFIWIFSKMVVGGVVSCVFLAGVSCFSSELSGNLSAKFRFSSGEFAAASTKSGTFASSFLSITLIFSGSIQIIMY